MKPKPLKVHLFHTKVWYCYGEELPCCSDMSIKKFIEAIASVTYVERFQVVGLLQNAELICALYKLAQEKELPLELVTPLVCSTAAERQVPDTLLQRMHNIALAPSQGGYHRMTDFEANIYAMTAILAPLQFGEVPEEARLQLFKLLSRNPLWERLQFINKLNPLPVAKVIARTRDPRWFIDPYRPERENRLLSYLGVMPVNQNNVSNSKPTDTGETGCLDVLQSWKNPEYAAQALRYIETIGPEPVSTSNLPGLHPKDFLWRIWATTVLGLNEKPANRVKADLQTSQYFIRFLRDCWLDLLYPGQGLFEPTRHLRKPCELEAYNKHMAQ